MKSLLSFRYMKRRCAFLDTLPAFNYNTGIGEPIIDESGQITRTDTRQLGSTLMATMLEEVNNFCHPSIQANWSNKPHQQVRRHLMMSVQVLSLSLSLSLCSLFMISVMAEVALVFSLFILKTYLKKIERNIRKLDLNFILIGLYQMY